VKNHAYWLVFWVLLFGVHASFSISDGTVFWPAYCAVGIVFNGFSLIAGILQKPK